MSKTALVFGGTGLVGSYIIEELIKDNSYSKLIAFNRKSQNYTSKKIEECIVNYNEPKTYTDKLNGDHLFICLGTTIKKAGSIEEMEKIDRDLPVLISSQAKSKGVNKVSIVSSVGANEKSKNYYLRIKGEMEKQLEGLNLDKLVIARPSMLLGARKEHRILEKLGGFLMNTLGFILIGQMRKYRAIDAQTVARAMILAIEQDTRQSIYESNDLQIIGAK